MIITEYLKISNSVKFISYRLKSTQFNNHHYHHQRWVIDKKNLPFRIAIQFTQEIKTELQFQLAFTPEFLFFNSHSNSYFNSIFNSCIDSIFLFKYYKF